MKGSQPTRLAIKAQPDTTTCGPTGLLVVYRHFGDKISDKIGPCAS